MTSPAIYGGLGATIAYSATGSTYTTIASVVSIDGPKLAVGSVETTNLASTVKSYRATLPDSAEVSFTIQYDPAQTTHQQLLTLYSTPVGTGVVASPAYFWQVTFTDVTPTVWHFQGLLTGYEITGLTVEGNVEANVTIRGTGTVTT